MGGRHRPEPRDAGVSSPVFPVSGGGFIIGSAWQSRIGIRSPSFPLRLCSRSLAEARRPAKMTRVRPDLAEAAHWVAEARRAREAAAEPEARRTAGVLLSAAWSRECLPTSPGAARSH